MGARFTSNADFRNAQFTSNASFGNAQFTGYASFGDAQFAGEADFGGALAVGLDSTTWPPGWTTRPATPDTGEDPDFLYLTRV
ncbi:MAG: pentapeptide repeat-containing protein [Pseudonocardiaceae bacterium]